MKQMYYTNWTDLPDIVKWLLFICFSATLVQSISYVSEYDLLQASASCSHQSERKPWRGVICKLFLTHI